MDTKEPGDESQQTDFTTILVSTIHDVKNSLGLVLHTLDEVMEVCTPQECKVYDRFARLHYEAKRVSNDLVRLLSLYKIGNQQLLCNISDYLVADFLEDCQAQNKPLLQMNGISVETECADDLLWYFDTELLAGVVNTVINNALRYAQGRLKLVAREENGFLRLSVEDDGQGYPETLLHGDADAKRGVSFQTGSTGLGLYFASVVARMHENQGRQGYVTISNGGSYGGGCFSIYIP
ncbi:MAG: HAMP domain-containing histidine kinase [Gammaproteobacteria bacterium]|nr:HAMP domain-containing histidine kinase [Gammaproteobacteria bacterium]